MTEGVPKPKVLLILEDSEDGSVSIGLVKDYHGSMPIEKDSESWAGHDVVGTWSRYDEGTLYVSLTNTVDAMQDTLIRLIKEVRSNPEKPTYFRGFKDEPAPKPSVKFKKTYEYPLLDEKPPFSEQDHKESGPSAFDSLRARLGKK
jgi:hypothetical protein